VAEAKAETEKEEAAKAKAETEKEEAAKAKAETEKEEAAKVMEFMVEDREERRSDHREVMEQLKKNQEALLKSFDKQSRLIVKATSDLAPRYMVLLPLQEVASGEDVLSRIKSFGKLAMAGLEGVVRKHAELWFLCEGSLAGVEGTCSSREPIIIERYNAWIVQAAPYLKYIAMALSLAAKLGTGLNLLDSAGVDCEALNALTKLYDEQVKIGKDGVVQHDDGMLVGAAEQSETVQNIREGLPGTATFHIDRSI